MAAAPFRRDGGLCGEAHFACLVLFDELDADSNHRLRTARSTCRIYRSFSVALAVLPRTVLAVALRFEPLLRSRERLVAAVVRQTPG